MQTQIFPSEIIENSAEVYLSKVSVRSQIIYVSVLLAILIAFLSLPFIKTEVSVSGSGVIRTVSDKNEIRASVSGVLAAINVKDNQEVKQGQLLFSVTSDKIDAQLRHNATQQSEKIQFIQDLQNLTQVIPSATLISSPLYKQQYNQYLLLLLEKKNQLKKAGVELERFEKLYKEKVIAPAEVEDKQFAFDKLKAEIQTLMATQRSQWEADLNKYQTETTELKAQEKQTSQEKTLYFIKSPIAGSMQELTGKYTGSFVQTGEVLGVISPDSNLVVECYLTPNDIGLLTINMPVRLQIDAFNYNEWGLINGKVIDIGHDFIMSNNQAVFKVKCTLEKQIMTLKNGYKGKLKKGMTLHARFIVAERSLFQWLYDKTSDWLDPKNK